MLPATRVERSSTRRSVSFACIMFLLGACTAAAVQGRAHTAEAPKTNDPIIGGATVIRLADAERRRNPPGTVTISVTARGENAFVGRLELAPGAKVPEHRDETEEYIVVLEGGGTMYIEGSTHRVGPGDTVYMPARAKVSFENGDAPTVAIQVFAGPAPAEKYDAWTVLPGD